LDKFSYLSRKAPEKWDELQILSHKPLQSGTRLRTLPVLRAVEILNHVKMANTGFSAFSNGWPPTPSYLAKLHGVLKRGTPLEASSGHIRQGQLCGLV